MLDLMKFILKLDILVYSWQFAKFISVEAWHHLDIEGKFL